MALILKGAVKLYYYLNDEIADPRTKDWPLMSTPWPGLAILVIYLLTVLRWLPEYMRNRPAYDLRKTIALYNAIQILYCVYVVYQSLKLGWLTHYKLICQPMEDGPTALEFAWKVCYTYFLIKIIDLLDTNQNSADLCVGQWRLRYEMSGTLITNPLDKHGDYGTYMPISCSEFSKIFFILRKKQNQVTFLHVYHHFGMVAVSWGMVKWVPGGHLTFIALINSFVHIIMYTYYLLTVWDESYKKSIWWKKHVTQIQIVQFTILLLHFTVLLVANDCMTPKQPSYILIPQNLFMVILFSDFYYRTYVKPKKNHDQIKNHKLSSIIRILKNKNVSSN